MKVETLTPKSLVYNAGKAKFRIIIDNHDEYVKLAIKLLISYGKGAPIERILTEDALWFWDNEMNGFVLYLSSAEQLTFVKLL